ncbi:sensor domain-containing diguanylate cyclase [Paenibacillus albidus]|uniref:sensor domain-containing diguanylate cyclase n=1 Tax=Paenibacillus albidus TaxID=2041023 RepID=UPI001666FF84|nr:diguanylate cyclase [Paenibacillus albidus]
MPWIQGYPYYLLMGSILSSYMSLTSYRYRKTAGRRYVWVLMLLIAFIFAATTAEIMSTTYTLKLFWRNMQQPPLFLSTIFTYAVIKEYVSRSAQGLSRRLFWFSLPVLLDTLLIFTDSYHHWMRSEVGMVTEAGITGITVQPTPLSMAFIAYDQLFGVYAVYLLTLSVWNAPKYYLRRNILLLTGLIIPVASIFLLPLLKIKITGFTAFVYLPATLAAYFSVFRDPRLSIYPLAKHKIFEKMKDGVVLTDRYDIIIDINAAGMSMLSNITGQGQGRWMGQRIQPLLEQQLELRACYDSRTEGQFEIEAPGPDGTCYGVSLSPTEPDLEATGMLIVFSDHSEKKRYERELLHQATVDDLTGLYNRRHFMRMVQNHGKQAQGGMALLLFDIDDFKLINDTFGHLGGDQALVELSHKIRSLFQDIGVAGRVGGEEFAVCFFAEDELAAYQQAENFRTNLGEYVILLDGGHPIRLTVSIGIAYTERSDVTFEDLYREADEAMYRSKATGKNRVTLSSQPVARIALKG